MKEMKKVVLIDGNSILNRAFYGLPVLTNSKGVYTNAVFGFINILTKILDEEKPDYITVAFDVKQPTFRHERYPEYKGTRKAAPSELIAQFPIIKEVLAAMNIRTIEKAGYEADDILGTIAKDCERKGMAVSLISGDRDLLQIATDNIMIRIPKTKRTGTEIENYNTKEVIEKYGIIPERITDLKGLMGDASDNIPGVPGIGEKTAIKILIAFDTLENAIEHIEEVKPNKAKESLDANRELAVLSKELATIKTDCELDYNVEDAPLGDIYNSAAVELFRQLEFKSLLNKISSLDNGDKKQNSTEEFDSKICVIDNLADCEKLITDIRTGKNDVVGFELIFEEALEGLAITYNENNMYFIKTEGLITKDYLIDKVLELIKLNIQLATIDLKSQFKILDRENASYISDIVPAGTVFDSSIAMYLLNPIASSYNYDDIANNYTSMTLPSYNEIIGKADKKKSVDNLQDKMLRIKAYSAYTSFASYKKLIDELKNEQMYELYTDIELPLINVLYDMESRGIMVDGRELEVQSKNLEKRIHELELLIYDITGEEFNINSPKQLGEILFDKMKLPFAKKTKTGYSTSADILEKLRSEHEIINYILEYRQVTKLKSTYTDGLVTYIQDDKRIRSTFNQAITATGRLSSTEPNLQNIPVRMALGREIRKAFIPKDGYTFVNADYSQIELRVLAHMSKDERLVEAYGKDSDIHRITASQVFDTPLEKVTKEQRSNAKAVNFGIVYGISSFGLGQDLNVSRKEAEQYINSYFKTYPKVKEYMDKLVETAKSTGYITTLYNRKRPVPEILSSNFMQRSFGERIAMNSPIQGTAADIIKIAMIKVNEKLRQNKMESRLILQIHDELIIETKNSETEEVKQIIHDEMMKAATLSVALEVDVNEGKTWFELK